MPRIIVIEQQRRRKRYGFWHFVLDVFLIWLTHGLWLLWIIIRYLRSNTIR